MMYLGKMENLDTIVLVRDLPTGGMRWREVHKVSNLLEDVFGDGYEESWVMAIDLMERGSIVCGTFPSEVARSKRRATDASIEAWELDGYRCA